VAVRFAADTAFFSRTATPPPETSFTLMAWAVQYVNTATFSTIISLDISSGDAFTIEFGSNGTTLQMNAVNSGATAFTKQPVIRQPICVAVTYDGTNAKGYFRRLGETRWDTVSAAATPASASAGISVGNYRQTPTGNGFRGAAWNFKVWNRALTPEQLMAESQANYMVDVRDANLFWRLRHPGDRADYGPHAQRLATRNGTPQPNGWSAHAVGLLNNWRPAIRKVDAASSANAFSLTITQGVYTLIGQSVVLRATRAIQPAQGQYLLTGQNVTLRVGRALLIQQGQYTLTGQSVTLRTGRALIISQGQYLLTGQSVELRAARSLQPETGVYQLIGQSVGLSVSANKFIQPETGIYRLTGQDVVLRATRALQPAQGQYLLTGQDVGLAAGRALQPQQGQYALAGQDVVLRTGRALLPETGVYTLTGQNVDLFVSQAGAKSIQPETGVYQLVGGSVELTFNQRPETPVEDFTAAKYGSLRFKPVTKPKKPPPEPPVVQADITNMPDAPRPPWRRGALLDLLDAAYALQPAVAAAPAPVARPAPSPSRKAKPVAAASEPEIDYPRTIKLLQAGWDEEREALQDTIATLRSRLSSTEAALDALRESQRIEREAIERAAKQRQRRQNDAAAAAAARLLLGGD
jgi:hypothetical protein